MKTSTPRHPAALEHAWRDWHPEARVFSLSDPANGFHTSTFHFASQELLTIDWDLVEGTAHLVIASYAFEDERRNIETCRGFLRRYLDQHKGPLSWGTGNGPSENRSGFPDLGAELTRPLRKGLA